MVLTACDLKSGSSFKPNDQRTQGNRSKPNPTKNPSILDHCVYWGLNDKEQIYGFIPMACMVLQTVISRLESSVQTSEDKVKLREAQTKILCLGRSSMVEPRTEAEKKWLAEMSKTQSLRHFHHGKSGTGKSFLIECLVDYQLAWGVGDCQETTSTSGLQATQILGVTTYHSFKMSITGHTSTVALKQLIVHWSVKSILVIDEISLMDPTILTLLDRKLRTLKGNELFFGGVHLIFCGDIFQMMRTMNVIIPPKVPNCPSANGQALFFVMFTSGTNMVNVKRSEKSPIFTAANSRLSTNSHTEADLELYNTRWLQNPEVSKVVGPNTFIAVTSHAEAAPIAHSIMQRYCQENVVNPVNPGSWRKRGIVLVTATIRRTGSHEKEDVPENLKDYILSMPNNSKQKRAHLLFFLIGGKYRITDNLEVEHSGIANGTRATGHDIWFLDSFDESMMDFVVDDSWGGGIHTVSVEHVVCYLLKHSEVRWATKFYSTDSVLDSRNILYPNFSANDVPNLKVSVGIVHEQERRNLLILDESWTFDRIATEVNVLQI